MSAASVREVVSGHLLSPHSSQPSQSLAQRPLRRRRHAVPRAALRRPAAAGEHTGAHPAAALRRRAGTQREERDGDG